MELDGHPIARGGGYKAQLIATTGLQGEEWWGQAISVPLALEE